jgi:hypothetical protein
VYGVVINTEEAGFCCEAIRRRMRPGFTHGLLGFEDVSWRRSLIGGVGAFGLVRPPGIRRMQSVA